MRSLFFSLAAGLLLATATYASPRCSAQPVEGNKTIVTFPCGTPKFAEYRARHPDKTLVCMTGGQVGTSPTSFVCKVYRKRIAQTP